VPWPWASPCGEIHAFEQAFHGIFSAWNLSGRSASFFNFGLIYFGSNDIITQLIKRPAGNWRAGFVLKEGPFVEVAPAVWDYE